MFASSVRLRNAFDFDCSHLEPKIRFGFYRTAFGEPDFLDVEVVHGASDLDDEDEHGYCIHCGCTSHGVYLDDDDFSRSYQSCEDDERI